MIQTAREARRWTPGRLALESGIDDSYIKKLEVDGCPPSYKTAEALARALDLNVAEALLRAGFAPPMPAEDWESILLGCRVRAKLHPTLRAAIANLGELSRKEVAEADAMLLGLAQGLRAARRQRRAS